MRLRALTILTLLSFTGCAADELPTLALLGFHGMKAEDDGCKRTDDYRHSTAYDTAIATAWGSPMNVYVHLRNEMAPHADPHVGQVEANRLEVRSMRVEYEGEGWAELPKPVEVPVTGVSIPPGGEYWKVVSPITPVEAEVLNRQLLPEIYEVRDIRVRLTFFGETLDGTEVQSNPLSFLVHACRECMLCPPGKVLVSLCAMSFAQSDGATCEDVEDVPEEEEQEQD